MLSCRLSSCLSFPQPPASPFQSARHCFLVLKWFGVVWWILGVFGFVFWGVFFVGFGFWWGFFEKSAEMPALGFQQETSPSLLLQKVPKKILCMVASSSQPPTVSRDERKVGESSPAVQTSDLQGLLASEMPSLPWLEQSDLALLFLKAQLNLKTQHRSKSMK